MLLLQICIWIYVIVCIFSILFMHYKYPEAKIINTRTNKIYDYGTKEYNIELIKLILKWPYIVILIILGKMKGEDEK